MLQEKLTSRIVLAAINVHRELGPGLLESVYEVCLIAELEDSGLEVKRQVPLPISYRGKSIENGLRLDLLIENSVVVELKAVESLLPIHQAQLLSYLKLSNKRIGLLLNFNVELLKDGLVRMVN